MSMQLGDFDLLYCVVNCFRLKMTLKNGGRDSGASLVPAPPLGHLHKDAIIHFFFDFKDRILNVALWQNANTMTMMNNQTVSNTVV
jgi:hypothetical protein